MLIEPKCYTRHCKYYKGISSFGEEESEKNICDAFPDGIPDEIAYGNNNHSSHFPGQGNEIVFEKGPFEWEED